MPPTRPAPASNRTGPVQRPYGPASFWRETGRPQDGRPPWKARYAAATPPRNVSPGSPDAATPPFWYRTLRRQVSCGCSVSGVYAKGGSPTRLVILTTLEIAGLANLLLPKVLTLWA